MIDTDSPNINKDTASLKCLFYAHTHVNITLLDLIKNVPRIHISLSVMKLIVRCLEFYAFDTQFYHCENFSYM